MKVILPVDCIEWETKILEKIFQHLSSSDLLRTRLVCRKWETVSNLYLNFERGTSFLALTKRIEIVDKIFSFLSTKHDRSNCRLVCFAFDIVAKEQMIFSPVLTDITKNGILKMDKYVRIRELKTEDLYIPLPVTSDGKLTCCFNKNNVKCLSFYEGTSSYNKKVLLGSFPYLEQLKYLWTSIHPFPTTKAFHFLTSLHIRGVSHKENENLQHFFAKSVFPQLKEINIELHFRRDLLLYMDLHKFIANHHPTLKTLQLEFKCHFFSDAVRENASNMLILLSSELITDYNQIVEQLKLTELETLIITFLDCEGTSMFHMSFTLLLAQTRLKTLSIVKEYTRTRREFLPLYITIKRNEKTLEDLSIPHPYSFNCASIQSCHLLKSLTVSHIWGTGFADSTVECVESLPRHCDFNKFRMSIRLRMTQIQWIIDNLQLTEFEFRGYHGEACSLKKIQLILKSQPSLTRLEFEAEMTAPEFKIMKIYFSWTQGIKMDWSHYDTHDLPSEEESRQRGEFHISIDRSSLDLKMTTEDCSGRVDDY